MKALQVIEPAQSYYLLSKDHKDTGNKPIFIGTRIELELALDKINSDMVIATSGNDHKCIVLMDYSTRYLLLLKEKADTKLLLLKDRNKN